MTTDFSDPSLELPDFPGPELSGAAGSVSSLDDKETSGPGQVVDSYRTFLASGQARKMSVVRSIYAVVGTGDPVARLAAYDNCRESAWFVAHKKTGEVKVASSRCGLRWCPLCEKTRRLVIINSVLNWMQKIKQPKFITLTLKHSDSPLAIQINALYKFFKQLRRRPFWRKHVLNGYWFFQVKLSDTDGLYHPHLHIVFSGRYTPHAELSQEWLKVTHSSKIVDVRAIENKKKAAEYVARYAACPCDLSKMQHDTAVEVVAGMHNRRICGAFGSARAYPLSPKKPVDVGDWLFLSSFRAVVFSLETSYLSNLIFESWRKQQPLPLDIIQRAAPPPKEILSVSIVEVDTYKQGLLF